MAVPPSPLAAGRAEQPLPALPLPAGVQSFAPLFNQSLNGFAVVDGARRYVWCSDSTCRLLGVDKASLLGCAPAPHASAARPPARHRSSSDALLGSSGARGSTYPPPAPRIISTRRDGASMLASHAAHCCLRGFARSLTTLIHARRVLMMCLGRRPVADLVLADDRPALEALLAEAGRAAVAESCAASCTFVRVRHAARDGSHAPVEIKACGDGTYLYCTLLDARMPAKLEGLLPDFLLSTSHDLRTPCCSIQSAASSLLASLPAVAADAEACSLLRAIDAACAVLLRVASNVLRLRQLQRDGQLTLAPLTAVDLRACVRRAVGVVCEFMGDPSRVAWADTALPQRVLVDEDALEACLQSILLATVRLCGWLPTHNVVRLRVAAEPLQPAMQLQVTTGLASQRATEASANAFVLHISAETPGRALTRDECERMMSPCGMAPADKARFCASCHRSCLADARLMPAECSIRRAAARAWHCTSRAAWCARWAASWR
jgi:hypothetical protein